ncbi:hypothetical protein LZ32DRAFT_443431 [Colletotrichum eremochloae]|nr:hypothetical protein LZ32DRAFT_443431 [Colletotrichum eremochloae]
MQITSIVRPANPPMSGRKLTRRYPSFSNPSRRIDAFFFSCPIWSRLDSHDISPPASNHSRGGKEGRSTSVATALVLLTFCFFRLFA